MAKDSIFIENVPKRPYDYYRRKNINSWISWEDFLSYDSQEKEDKYLEFEKARNFVRDIKLNNQKEWTNWCLENDTVKLKIPTNPNVYYELHKS